MTITGAAPHWRPAAASTEADPLERARERIEAMAHLGAWRIDLRTGLAAWTAGMYRILGLDASAGPDPDAESLARAVHQADRTRFADAMAAAIGGGRGSAECRIVRPDGTASLIRVAAEREADGNGHGVALIGFIQELAQVDATNATGAATGAGLAGAGLAGADRPEAPSAHPAPVRRPARVSAGVVLLVEDEDMVRSVLGRMLGGLGYSVFEASSADEALELVGYDADGIDLVVTDIRMPGIQGPELARRIRKVLPDVPVLFVSGYTADLDPDLRHADHTHVLEKPFDAESLGRAISTVRASAT